MADGSGPPRIAVAQLGARMHYAVPRIFHEAGMLERLFTDTYIGNKPWLEACLHSIPMTVRPHGIDRWLGRNEPAIPPAKVTSYDWLGIYDALTRWRTVDFNATAARLARLNNLFANRVASTDLSGVDAVWAFNYVAEPIFTAARSQKRRCILEQTMAPRRMLREIIREELDRWSNWQPSLAIPGADDPLIQCEEREWPLADEIICGSQFVIDELVRCGVPRERCRCVPYGVDTRRFGAPGRRSRDRTKPLRVLFAGEVGLRKGVPYLLEALRILGPRRVNARLAGRISLDPARLRPFSEVASFLGPLPRTHMPDQFAWADVFVLPSLCEGSAVSTYEAMLSGCPVICTPNTGVTPVRGMVTIVRVRDSRAIAEALDSWAERLEDIEDDVLGAVQAELDLSSYARRLLKAVTTDSMRVASTDRTSAPEEARKTINA